MNCYRSLSAQVVVVFAMAIFTCSFNGPIAFANDNDRNDQQQNDARELGAQPDAGQPAAGQSDVEHSNAQRLVREALCHEIYGRVDEFESALDKAAELSPGNPQLQWRRGRIFRDGKWITLDENAKQVKADDLLVQYQKIRNSTSDSEQGHFALAVWCAERRIIDRAIVHLQRVIEFNADNLAARHALGHQKINGQWLGPDEFNQYTAKTMVDLKRLEAWRNELDPISQLVANGSDQSFRKAITKLTTIKDPSAVRSMEILLAGISPEFDIELIKHIGSIKSLESIDALSRFAIVHRDRSLRTLAAEQLSSFDQYDFVPQLLSNLTAPWISGWDVVANERGHLMLRQTLFQQGQDKNRVIQQNQIFQPISVTSTPNPTILDAKSIDPEKANSISLSNIPVDVVGYQHQTSAYPEKFTMVRERIMVDRYNDVELLNQMILRINAQLTQSRYNQTIDNIKIEQLNTRICDVLRQSTGEKFGDEPATWWSWWNEKIELVRTQSKSTDVTTETKHNYIVNDKVEFIRDSKYLLTPIQNGSASSGGQQRYIASPIIPHSCLVAGTLVETETGPVAVEDINTGDKVLTKDVDSGALSFQPVMRPTVRPPQPLFEIDLGDEIIKCTGGHLFWVSGEGWVKARNLESGMPIHAVQGVVAVKSVKQNGKSETHNLIVSNNSNYFVGKSRILSHDNSVRQPTSVAVPGLLENQ